MQKPITVARRDFIDALNKLVSESGLPAFVLGDIFKDAIMQIQRLENEQYEQEKKAYEESMKEAEE